MIHEWAHCCDEAANHQLAIAVAFGIMPPNRFCGGMFKLNAKSDAYSLLCLLSHFECDGHTVHMLTQWCHCPPLPGKMSHHCSHMYIPVHSPWLPSYIDVMQTIIVMLTMV